MRFRLSYAGKFSSFREHPFLTTTIVVGLLTRILYDLISVQSGELINWIFVGRAASTESLPLGIYAAGAYMFSLAYRMWMALPVDHPSLETVYVGTWPSRIFQPSLASYVLVFSMKTPIMISDVLILVLIMRVVVSKTGSSKTALLAAASWAWNPLVTLLENYNGIDVAAAFFLILAAYLFERKKSVLASTTLAIGALLRVAPALFLPAFALGHLRRGEWRGVLKVLGPSSLLIGGAFLIYGTIYGLGAFGAIMGQRQGLLVYEALAFMGPALKPRLGVAWNGFMAFNLLLYFLLLPLTSNGKSGGFGDQITSVLLAFFATSWFHFAFFLWLLPFLTIDNLGLNRRIVLYLLQTAAGLMWTIFQASTAVFSFGTSILFVPVTPDLIPISRALSGLQFHQGLEYLRAVLSGALLVQLALIVRRNLLKTEAQPFSCDESIGETLSTVNQEQKSAQKATGLAHEGYALAIRL